MEKRFTVLNIKRFKHFVYSFCLGIRSGRDDSMLNTAPRASYRRGKIRAGFRVTRTTLPGWKIGFTPVSPAISRCSSVSVILKSFRVLREVGGERFSDDHDAVDINVLKHLLDAAGPANLNSLDVPV